MKNYNSYVCLLLVLLVIVIVIGVMTYSNRQTQTSDYIQRMTDRLDTAAILAPKATPPADPFLAERQAAFVEGRPLDFGTILRQQAWDRVYGGNSDNTD